jgi:hypothetical protein
MKDISTSLNQAYMSCVSAQVTGIEAVPLAAVGPEFPQIHHKITSAPRPANCKGLVGDLPLGHTLSRGV